MMLSLRFRSQTHSNIKLYIRDKLLPFSPNVHYSTPIRPFINS